MKTTRRILESAYFHINNGGLEYSIVEETIEDDDPDSDSPVIHQYFLELSQGHMGVETSYRTPLFPAMVKFLISAMQSTYDEIITQDVTEGHGNVEWPGYAGEEISVRVKGGVVVQKSSSAKQFADDIVDKITEAIKKAEEE